MLNFLTKISAIPAAFNFSSLDFKHSLGLMGKGMLGIILVMLVIYLVIAILNRSTKKGNHDGENNQ